MEKGAHLQLDWLRLRRAAIALGLLTLSACRAEGPLGSQQPVPEPGPVPSYSATDCPVRDAFMSLSVSSPDDSSNKAKNCEGAIVRVCITEGPNAGKLQEVPSDELPRKGMTRDLSLCEESVG